MEFSALQISLMLQGEVEGNPDAKVWTLSKIEEGETGSLSFLSNPKYTSYIYSTKASVVIVSNTFVADQPIQATLIRVADPYIAFTALLEQYNNLKLHKSGIESPSHISPSATIGENPYIGAFAYIGNDVKIGNNVKIYPQVYVGDGVTIGDNCTLYPGVSVYHDCVLGEYVIVHGNTVIGGDGFGFAPQPDGTYKKIPQIGNVVIEDHVEIGANTTIDRATMGSTIIRRGVKLDNLIQIAHNVEIGSNTVIASQSGVSGSTKIGEESVIGGQVGIVGHITIAPRTKINAKTGINRSIEEENKAWNGIPATDYRHSLKVWAVQKRLPELEKRIEELERLLIELKATV